MVMRSVALGAAVAAAFALYYCLTGLRRNIAAAKASGLPYIISRTPYRFLYTHLSSHAHPTNLCSSMLTVVPTMAGYTQTSDPYHPPVPRILVGTLAGVSLTMIYHQPTSRLTCHRPITPDFSWIHHHGHFARHGDTFLLVSPGAMHLFVANAEAIHQITTRRDHFPKYTDIYEILSQFGQNLLTSEGAVWRAHRRATAPSFNEHNVALVFRESVRQSLGLLRF